jgi:hypothetical protein
MEDDFNDDDNLYKDLSATTTKCPPTKRQKLSAVAASPIAAPSEQQLQELTEENQRLKRNIGTLYRTAKAEIKRKNDEINRLKTELETLKKR